MFEKLEMHHFPFSESDGKMRHFRIFENKKVGQFEGKSRDRFQREEKSKTNMFDLWTFQDFRAHVITCKNILHMLFGGISRNLPYYVMDTLPNSVRSPSSFKAAK